MLLAAIALSRSSVAVASLAMLEGSGLRHADLPMSTMTLPLRVCTLDRATFAGDVGVTLANGFMSVMGADVKMGGRDAASAKATAWLATTNGNPKASIGTFQDAAAFGDIVVLCTVGHVAVDLLKSLAAAVHGKVVIDATNPLAFEQGKLPMLSPHYPDSLGAQLQKAVPGAHIVKAFNMVGHKFMVKPAFPDGKPTMFIAGNDAPSKRTVASILDAFEWETIDLGDISQSSLVEALAMVWIHHGFQSGTWAHAFKLMKMPAPGGAGAAADGAGH